MLSRLTVLLLSAAAFGCDADVREPVDNTGGGGADSGANRVRVVAVIHEQRVDGLVVIVNAADGALLSEHTTSAEPIEVAAEPGDSVALVWKDPSASGNQGWNLDSVRVVEGMTDMRFEVVAPYTPSPTNAPVRIEADIPSFNGVEMWSIRLSCQLPVEVEAGQRFTFDDFVGCPNEPESEIVLMGVDADYRPVSFEHATFAHDEDTVRLQFRGAEVHDESATVELVWQDVSFEWISVGSYCLHGSHFCYRPDPPTYVEATSPVVLEFSRPQLPLGTTLLSVSGDHHDDGDCSTSELHAALVDGQTYDLERLASPRSSFSDRRWSLSATGERGDAVVIDFGFRDHRFRWIEPPPASSEPQAIVAPTLPADLAELFEGEDTELDFPEIRHDDRAAVTGYRDYVADGVGERNQQVPLERASVTTCGARF